MTATTSQMNPNEQKPSVEYFIIIQLSMLVELKLMRFIVAHS